MPIKGVSEVVRLPRLGKIKLGIKNETEDGTISPVPTDYFVCPDEVKKVFGEKPRELRMMFPTEDKEQWASQYLRRYSDSLRLVCRGDGETAVARFDTGDCNASQQELATANLREIACIPSKCSYYKQVECRRVMNLQFLLPECPGFGVYQLDTTSIYSIVNVNSGVELIQGTCGRLSMIPLSLKLVEQEVEPDGKRKIVHVLRLTTHYSFAQIQKYAQVPPGQVLLLPPPDNEAPGDLTFPKATLEKLKSRPTVQDEEGLMDLWARVKSKISLFDIQNYQLVKWFKENYDLIADPKDFGLPVPPRKFTSSMLSFFCNYVDMFCLPQF